MPLPEGFKVKVARLMRDSSDAAMRKPLWEFHPYHVPFVQHERRVRFQWDDEPIGDPQYS